MLIGNRLKQLRIQAGDSQQDLAVKLNVSRQVISKWETDKSQPELAMLVQLARYYDLSLNDLLEVTTTTNQPNLLTRFRRYLHPTETTQGPETGLAAILQQPERQYPDLIQQFSQALTNVAFAIDGQTLPANWRRARTPYLFELAPGKVIVQATDYLKIKHPEIVKQLATDQIRAVQYAILQTAGPSGPTPLPGIGHAYQGVLTVVTKQRTTPFYCSNLDYRQLAAHIKAYAQREQIQFEDSMGIIAYLTAHSAPECYDYLEQHYAELAAKAGFPESNLSKVIYRW